MILKARYEADQEAKRKIERRERKEAAKKATEDRKASKSV